MEQKVLNDFAPKEDLKGNIYPPIELMDSPNVVFSTVEVIETKDKLIITLSSKGIGIHSIETTVGYSILLYFPKTGQRVKI